VIPERDGEPLLETLAHPLDFHGIVGHLHVDLDRQKWDPGAFDWNASCGPCGAIHSPTDQGLSEVPRTRDELLAARKAAFFASEERVTGFFPLAPARLWHSGIHLRGRRGSPVLAPARGRIVAARRAEQNGSSTSFVLLRHEVELDGRPLTFFSLLFHLSLPALSDENPIPWMRALMAPEKAAQRAALESGSIALLDERVEAGDRVGLLGSVSRGPEQGPELHFEIFTSDKPPLALAKSFHYLNAATDGPLVRRAFLWPWPTGTTISRSTRMSCVASFTAMRSIGGRPCGDWSSCTATSGAAKPPWTNSWDCVSCQGSQRRIAVASGPPQSSPTSSGPMPWQPTPACLQTKSSTHTTPSPFFSSWPRRPRMSTSPGHATASATAGLNRDGLPMFHSTTGAASHVSGAGTATAAAHWRGPCAQTQRPDSAHRAAAH